MFIFIKDDHKKKTQEFHKKENDLLDAFKTHFSGIFDLKSNYYHIKYMYVTLQMQVIIETR